MEDGLGRFGCFVGEFLGVFQVKISLEFGCEGLHAVVELVDLIV